MKFAVIDSGYVTNFIVAESKEIAEEVTGLLCVQAYSVAMNSFYDEETGEFTPPIVPEELLPEEEPTV